jgi:hypothetical protein
MNSNYGKYVHNLKAFDKNGKELSVSAAGGTAGPLKKQIRSPKITYNVEDTWDATIKNMVLSPCVEPVSRQGRTLLSIPRGFSAISME